MSQRFINLAKTKELIEGELMRRVGIALEALEGRRLTEMRDAPDNAMYPLSRTEVERLLTQYERRSDDPYADEADTMDRSIEGMKRARWYPPEVKSDYTLDPDSLDDIHDENNRPAKLMPYDYQYTVYKHSDTNEPEAGISDSDDESQRPENYSGEYNVYEQFQEGDQVKVTGKVFGQGKEGTVTHVGQGGAFVVVKHNDGGVSSYHHTDITPYEEDEDEDENEREDMHESDSKSVFDHTSATGTDVQLDLADGNFVYLDPHTSAHIKSKDCIDDMHKSMGSLEDFQAFLDKAYEKTPSVGHAPVIKPGTVDDYDHVQESSIYAALTEAAMAAAQQYNPNFKAAGRLAIVNRVRGGDVQMRKLISTIQGWKVVDGTLVKMTPDEVRRRKRGAKIAARKRESEMSQVNRQRMLSMKIRQNRLAHYKAVDDV